MQNEEAEFKYQAKEISGDTFRETDVALSKDRNALRARYPERGAEFDKAMNAAASSRIAQLRAKYTGKPAPQRVAAQPKPESFDWLPWAALIVMVGGGIWIYRWLMNLPPKFDPDPPVSDIYGSADFAPPQEDIPHSLYPMFDAFFGRHYLPHGAPVCSTPEHHTLIVAPTRTGKGTRVIVPTLLRYAHSALVIDPKGENAAITARIRRDQLRLSDAEPNAVHIVNPWNTLVHEYARLGFTSATYNPLDVLDRNDPNVVALAQSMANTISPPSADSKDSYWSGSAAALISGVLLWITDQPGETKTLGRLRQIVTMTRKKLRDDFLIPMSASEAFGGGVNLWPISHEGRSRPTSRVSTYRIPRTLRGNGSFHAISMRRRQ